MSMSGWALRDSAHTHTGSSTAAATNSATTPAEPQPQLCPWLTASSRATSQAESSSALPTLIEPSVRSGDSGTTTAAATAARAVITIGNQNSQW